MPMSPRLLRPRAGQSGTGFDADARAYILAVEAADGQALETAVGVAINDFVVGCKADGIWSAIKASCILMGARTLSGCLTPLVGTAPTNTNFVSGDYNRKTGLIGNGTTKSINTGRNNNDDPQDSFHLSVYASAVATSGSYYIGDLFESGWSGIVRSSGNILLASRRNSGQMARTAATGFIGVSRGTSAQFVDRISGTSTTNSAASQSPSGRPLRVFASSAGGGGTGPGEWSNARIAFYSIGENVDLALLDSRIAGLYTAIGAAIP